MSALAYEPLSIVPVDAIHIEVTASILRSIPIFQCTTNVWAAEKPFTYACLLDGSCNAAVKNAHFSAHANKNSTISRFV